MARSFFPYFLVFVFILMVASCAGVDDKAQDIQRPAEIPGVDVPGSQLFPAWRQDKSTADCAGENKAVQQLLQQADELINRSLMEQASDKLERLLRIESVCAQAWSRLAWIALENKDPRRTQQMAQRSNSYAQDDNKLKLLNWSFIKQAGQQTGDEATITRAESMINSLGGL